MPEEASEEGALRGENEHLCKHSYESIMDLVREVHVGSCW